MNTQRNFRTRPGAVLAVVLALLGLGSPADAQIPRVEKSDRVLPDRYEDRVPPRMDLRSRGLAAFDEITEAEPNDEPATATPVAVGDIASGVIDPEADLDFYALDVGEASVLVLDVDASEVGSALDPVLTLFDEGGTVIAFNDDFDGLDSRIRFGVPAGRYFVSIADFSAGGSPSHTYALIFDALEPGPGDPTTLTATGLGAPLGMTAGAGVFYVADTDGRLLEVGLDGAVTTLLTGDLFIDVAVDGFGDVLVTELSFAGNHQVRRVGSDGTAGVFLDGLPNPAEIITVGPDGDVWLSIAGETSHEVRRYSPLGDLKEVRGLPPPTFPRHLAFSPAGELHYTTDTGVFVLSSTGSTQVIAGDAFIESLAFDEEGFLYVSNGFLGEIRLYDPSYVEVTPAFAMTNLGGPTYIAFARNPDGSMTSRLFATNQGFNLNPPFIGSMVEANPAGIRAPGHRVGVDLLRLSDAPLPAAVLGAEYDAQLEAADGQPAIWTLVSGTLPAGLDLSSSGRIVGVPEESGAFAVTVRAEAGGEFGFGAFALQVSRPELLLSSVVDELLGVTGLLSEAEVRFLDLEGNRNGRLDIGDLQALLRRGEAQQ